MHRHGVLAKALRVYCGLGIIINCILLYDTPGYFFIVPQCVIFAFFRTLNIKIVVPRKPKFQNTMQIRNRYMISISRWQIERKSTSYPNAGQAQRRMRTKTKIIR